MEVLRWAAASACAGSRDSASAGFIGTLLTQASCVLWGRYSHAILMLLRQAKRGGGGGVEGRWQPCSPLLLAGPGVQVPGVAPRSRLHTVRHRRLRFRTRQTQPKQVVRQSARVALARDKLAAPAATSALCALLWRLSPAAPVAYSPDHSHAQTRAYDHINVHRPHRYTQQSGPAPSDAPQHPHGALPRPPGDIIAPRQGSCVDPTLVAPMVLLSQRWQQMNNCVKPASAASASDPDAASLPRLALPACAPHRRPHAPYMRPRD
jgi:hypothetical protein